MKSSFFVHNFFIFKISNSFSLFIEDWSSTRRKINQARLQNLQKTCQAHPELSLHEEMHNAQAKSLYTSPGESYQGHNMTFTKNIPSMSQGLSNAEFRSVSSIWVPVNTYQDWTAKIENALMVLKM